MERLEVSSLSYRYPGGAHNALSSICLSIGKGEFISLLGPNGSGKSTLALILAGLKKESGGRINLSEDERRRKVRIVFQNPDNQIIGETVEEDVAFGPENLNLTQNEIRERVDEALKSVGLYEKRHLPPSSLSGGERQKEAVASALALRPDILVLDEASSMLDKKSSQNILKILRKECREHKKSVVYITHHTDETILSDRIYILNKGRIIKSGTPEETLQYDILTQNNLSVPYPVEVAWKLGLGKSLTLSDLKEKIIERIKHD